MFLSVIIPVQNEEGNVPPLGEALSAILGPTGWSWECIWIDDHSTDGTNARVRNLARSDPRHIVRTLSIGKGQSAALVEGFRHAQGQLIATIDGDGQNDPADIPRLVEHLESSRADMVNGRRFKRRDDLIRKIVSPLGNLVRNLYTGERLNDVGCGIRVFRRECVTDLSIHTALRGMHRFMPSVARLNGRRRIEEIHVNHRRREKGKSKYTALDRLPDFLHDMIVVRRHLRRLPPNPWTWRRPSVDRRKT